MGFGYKSDVPSLSLPLLILPSFKSELKSSLLGEAVSKLHILLGSHEDLDAPLQPDWCLVYMYLHLLCRDRARLHHQQDGRG